MEIRGWVLAVFMVFMVFMVRDGLVQSDMVWRLVWTDRPVSRKKGETETGAGAYCDDCPPKRLCLKCPG
jgi:hypothetical protein